MHVWLRTFGDEHWKDDENGTDGEALGSGGVVEDLAQRNRAEGEDRGMQSWVL